MIMGVAEQGLGGVKHEDEEEKISGMNEWGV